MQGLISILSNWTHAITNDNRKHAERCESSPGQGSFAFLFNECEFKRCVIRQLPTMPHHGKIDCLSEERRDSKPKFHRPLQLLNQKWRNIKPKHDMEAAV
ncbi:hypothetical protein P5673_015689 [Acropora cervicornis]|uniref:Uncharacterized protein n=1 Tax=Acropora cervicornis TaxID=6130 RepID=A0AAD9QHW7_ACRCE|nr:hypothetical protein P5673_015689 [Acropora cervicornis]